MSPFPISIVLRHRKENLKKCSLRGLEERNDFQFFTYPQDSLPLLDGYITLTLDAPTLSKEDDAHGVFLIDATWRYAEVMARQIAPSLVNTVPRSIPRTFVTAYPRYQTGCAFPEYGLASIEALYIAYFLLGRDVSGLLDNYHWKDQFLEINKLYP